MKQIAIYDDESGLAQDYTNRLSKLLKTISQMFEVERMSQDDFETQLTVLRNRQEAVREGRKWTDDSIDLDKTSIFIVDFDLFQTSSFLTGEEVAYMARCFSRCGLIIGVNLDSRKRVSPSYFDLTLTGHPESFCDLNIDATQIDNPGLWTDDRAGFRPWHWPLLPEYFASMEKKIDDALGNPAKPIMEFLHFNKILQLFPNSALRFLGGKPEEVTFGKFVRFSGNGIRGRDKANEEMVARIAAARVSKWLERLVLSGQDIVVDAPHLVSRFPSLLLGDHNDLATWNKTSALSNKADLGIERTEIEKFSFKMSHWLSRPAWFWNDVYTCSNIKEVAEPWKAETAKFAFCEDSSTFEKKEDCKEFNASVDSPYNRRYMHALQFPDVDYAPKVLLVQ